ncbi:hypothetical protein H6F61_12275 [Cyanobacteria bacterium FACHB-472]|nr:hypothetical protein [Cyanobacteria bacterium FACHB-472]
MEYLDLPELVSTYRELAHYYRFNLHLKQSFLPEASAMSLIFSCHSTGNPRPKHE